MKWLINVPVWDKEGDRYRLQFLRRGLPSIYAAMTAASLSPSDVRWLFHTDRPQSISVDHDVEFRPIPPGKNNPERLGNAVRIGLDNAKIGEAVMFFNADMTISKETFKACERRFYDGKIFVTAHSVRVRDAVIPPVGLNARALLEWGWNHRHPWVDDCTYNRGHVAGPAIVVFERGAYDGFPAPQLPSVVAHCFSLQCLAVHKIDDRKFTGPSADEFCDIFTKDEVHVVTNADELSMVESCSENLEYDRLQPLPWLKYRPRLTDRVILGFAKFYASEMMAWQFKQQIVIKGGPNPSAQHIADRLWSKIDTSKLPVRLIPYSQDRFDYASKYHLAPAARGSLIPWWIPRNMRQLAGLIPRRVRHLLPQSIRGELLRWI